MGIDPEGGALRRMAQRSRSLQSREDFMIPAGFKLGHEIRAVDVLPNYRLRLTYTDGYSGELDFWPYIEWGEAVAPLKSPALFSTAHVGSRGRSLEWIGPNRTEIDFCADALRMDLEGLRQRRSAVVTS